MARQTQYDAWAMILMQYLIFEQGYRMLGISADTEEIWLVHPQKSEANPILITSSSLKELKQDLILRKQIELGQIFKPAQKAFVISTHEDSQGSDDRHVVCTAAVQTPSSLYEIIPELKSLLKEGQLAPQREIRPQAKRSGWLNLQLKDQKATLVLASLMTVIFLLGQILIYFENVYPSYVAVLLGAFYKPLIVGAYEYWRLLTAGFIHVDLMHFFMNLISLVSLGAILEARLGWKKYMSLVLAGIVFGNGYHFVMNTGGIALGMSGGLYALFAAYFVLLFETGLIRNRQISSNMISIILLNLFISLMPNVSWEAHLGGFQIGLVLALIFSRKSEWQGLRKIMHYVLLASALMLAFMMTRRTDFDLNQAFLNAFYEFLRYLRLDFYADHLIRLMS